VCPALIAVGLICALIAPATPTVAAEGEAESTILPTVRVGDYVRGIYRDDGTGGSLHPFEGRVGELSADELLLLSTPRRPQTTLPLQGITQLELRVRTGLRTRGAGYGALVGLGLAAIGGAVSGGSSDDCVIFCLSSGDVALLLGVLFIPTGAAVGALLPPGSEWERVDPEQFSSQPHAGSPRWSVLTMPHGGAGVGLTGRF